MLVLGSHRIWPLRMMFIASYPAIVFNAPCTERNHWLERTRFFTYRWSCSRMLFMYSGPRDRYVAHPRLDGAGLCNRKLEKALCGNTIAVRPELEIDRVPSRIDG